MSYEKQFRATFEDTKLKQKKFRHKLDQLIIENRALKADERDTLFELYNDSNIGLGGIETVFWFSDGKKIRIPNLEKFVRDIFYYEHSLVDQDFFFFSLGQNIGFSVSIGEIWKQIRSKVNQVDAEALTQTIRISKEQNAPRERNRISRKGYNDHD